MQCREFREIADSYLSNELMVETNHGVIAHLEQCAECRQELKARRELRGKLRESFIKAPENQLRPEFVARLSSQLHDYSLGKRGASPRRWQTSVTRKQTTWLALAACLLLAMGLGLVFVRKRLGESKAPEIAASKPKTNDSPELNPGIPVSIVKTELANSAVGDHRDCAIKFRLAEKPIDLEVAGQKYDPVYINLTKVVLSQQGTAPLDAQFVEAHSCVFEGRRFAHIVLKYHGQLVSFLVTDIEPTKDVQPESVRRAAEPQVITCSQFDGYKVSCFETARHAVFIVSDLPEGDNLALARALAPSVFAHIMRTENHA
jgi:Putative zinc-finger